MCANAKENPAHDFFPSGHTSFEQRTKQTAGKRRFLPEGRKTPATAKKDSLATDRTHAKGPL